MEELTILSISTQWRGQSHKWEISQYGTVLYRGETIQPREAYERFLVDYPIFNVTRAEIIKRLPNNGEGRDYMWIDIERFQ